MRCNSKCNNYLFTIGQKWNTKALRETLCQNNNNKSLRNNRTHKHRDLERVAVERSVGNHEISNRLDAPSFWLPYRNERGANSRWQEAPPSWRGCLWAPATWLPGRFSCTEYVFTCITFLASWPPARTIERPHPVGRSSSRVGPKFRPAGAGNENIEQLDEVCVTWLGCQQIGTSRSW